MVSLEDFKGKYAYIDFWATWCVNCIKEFKKMVVKKELKNVQLFAPSQGCPEKMTSMMHLSN